MWPFKKKETVVPGDIRFFYVEGYESNPFADEEDATIKVEVAEVRDAWVKFSFYPTTAITPRYFYRPIKDFLRLYKYKQS
jgi:hypothetical protein